MRIGLVQTASGLDPDVNRRALAGVVPAGQDLVVLPEAFHRDFGSTTTDQGATAEPLNGPFATEVARVAAAQQTTVVAGMFEPAPDPERPFNTLIVRGGAEAAYRKIHLYDSFGYRESDRLSAGALSPTVVEVAGWRVGLMTCYDLRFPELARALVDQGADLLVVPAAWVAGPGKLDHWRTLLMARAIENTAYVAAVGQPAPRYTGHSLLVAPDGVVLVEAGDDAETVTGMADPELLSKVRATNPSLQNRRL